MQKLGARVSAGMKWLLLARGARMAVNLGTIGILARFLGAEEFGQIALLLFIAQLAAVMSDFGTKHALVQQPEVSETEYSSVFWFNLSCAVFLTVVILFFAEDIARLMGSVEIAEPLVWFSAIFLIAAMRVVPSAQLERSFLFGRVAVVETVTTVTGAVAALVLVALGFRIGALVGQQLAMATVATILTVGFARWRPALDFRLDLLMPIVRFGGQIALAGLVHFASLNLSRPIIANGISSAALGHFSIAQQIIQAPMMALRATALRPLYPALSLLQNDFARLRSGHLRALHALAFLTMPACLGIASLAEPIVLLVLGEGWQEVPPLIRIMSLMVALSGVAVLNSTILTALRRGSFQLAINCVAAVLRIAALLFSVQFGLVAVVVAMLLVEVLVAFGTSALVFPLFGQRMGAALGAIAKPLLASVVMCVVVAALADRITLPALWEVILLVPTGAAIYGGIMAAIDRPALLSYVALLKAKT